MLRALLNLKFLHLHLHSSEYIVRAIRPPIWLPRLQTLLLDFHEDSCLPILPTSFDAPNLEKLVLFGDINPEDNYWGPETADIASCPNRFPKLSNITIESVQLDLSDEGGISEAAAALIRAHAHSLRHITIVTEETYATLRLNTPNFFTRAFGPWPYDTRSSNDLITPPALESLSCRLDAQLSWGLSEDEYTSSLEDDCNAVIIGYVQCILRQAPGATFGWEAWRPRWYKGFEVVAAEFGSRLIWENPEDREDTDSEDESEEGESHSPEA